MEQVHVQAQAQAQVQDEQEEECEVEIICEVFYNQALLDVEPVQAQEVVGPYDQWQDEVQILEEIIYPRENPYVIYPGQPPRIVYYDEEPQGQDFYRYRERDLIWRPAPGENLSPVEAMARRLDFDQNIYEMYQDLFEEQQAEIEAAVDEGEDYNEGDLENENQVIVLPNNQDFLPSGNPRIVYR